MVPFLAQGLISLTHRWQEPGEDILSPHLQVQGGIKMTYQETRNFFFPSLTWQNGWLPFPQQSYSTSPQPCVLLGIFHFQGKDQDLLRTSITDNICDDASQEQLRSEIPTCYLC
jgi:hypothetical protein